MRLKLRWEIWQNQIRADRHQHNVESPALQLFDGFERAGIDVLPETGIEVPGLRIDILFVLTCETG